MITACLGCVALWGWHGVGSVCLEGRISSSCYPQASFPVSLTCPSLPVLGTGVTAAGWGELSVPWNDMWEQESPELLRLGGALWVAQDKRTVPCLAWSCAWGRRDSALHPQRVPGRLGTIFPVCLSCINAISGALPPSVAGSRSAAARGRWVMGSRNLPVGCYSDPGASIWAVSKQAVDCGCDGHVPEPHPALTVLPRGRPGVRCIFQFF